MTRIVLDRLTKRFGDHTALHGIDVDLPDGSFLVLLGPSGCGKTTTLRMLAGLEQPSSGTITFGDVVVSDPAKGIDLSADRRRLGMVFQSYALWPHMSVRANVEWPLQVAGWSREDRVGRIDEVLAALEISQLADRQPAQISGGQQQRVAIARTIAPRPGVLLFDEPLSNLDARLRVETRAELVRLHRMTGATSVYVTHDQVEALAMATHIAVMNKGRIEQLGTPAELLDRPETAFVASFLGTPPAVLLGGDVIDGTLFCDGVPLVDGAQPGTRVMYRPQDLVLDPEGALAFEVLESTPMAGRHVVTGLVAKQRVSVITEAAATAGETTALVIPPKPAAVFDAEGRRQ
ncbi:ABC transporter ATP-binding protein [Rhodococcus sp. RS1C4]|uniref:ABC transporter ATP-binding protein n=1 Tax=Rhodococcoides fascians TaxID=1828 RepID=UPI00056D29EB|nr:MULTISPECIES: ABC transporter ATP-binding protein [Rhodococcus]OZC58582.1 ABC transporter ATP-binding protein [Rhodococcus sp. RS1C4]